MKKQALVAAFSLVAPMILGSTGVFATSLTESNTDVNAKFTVPDTNTNNPTPNNPSTGTGTDNNTNVPLDPDGNFALAYVPYGLDFGTIQLNNNGPMTQNLALQDGQTLNVGVKDTLHNTEGWTLSAQFSGALADEGVTIGTTTSKAQVYNESNSLVDLSDNGMITVTPNATINSQQKVLMQGNQGHNFSGTYDMNLGDVSLQIPDASKVSQGQTSGTITWSLTKAPQAPQG